MASHAGKTVVLALFGLVVAIAAVGCDSGDVNDVGRSPASPVEATQAPEPPSTNTPVAPATLGVALEPLSTPPERSLWALPSDSYGEGLEIEVEFEPYGLGPAAYGPSIVAKVSTANARNPGEPVPDLVGRNVVFILGDQVVKSGGRYRATVVTRKQDDRIVLVLEDVKPATEP